MGKKETKKSIKTKKTKGTQGKGTEASICKAVLEDGSRCKNICAFDGSQYSNWCVEHAPLCSRLNADYKSSSCKGFEKWGCYNYVFGKILKKGEMKDISVKEIEDNIYRLYNCIQSRRTFESQCIHESARDELHENFLENLTEMKSDCEEMKPIVRDQEVIREEKEKERKRIAEELKKQRKKEKKANKDTEDRNKDNLEESIAIINESQTGNISPFVQSLTTITKKEKRKKEKDIQTEDEILNEAIQENLKYLASAKINTTTQPKIVPKKTINEIKQEKKEKQITEIIQEDLMFKKEQMVEKELMNQIMKKAKVNKKLWTDYYLKYLGITEDQLMNEVPNKKFQLIINRTKKHFFDFVEKQFKDKNPDYTINEFVENGVLNNLLDMKLRENLNQEKVVPMEVDQ